MGRFQNILHTQANSGDKKEPGRFSASLRDVRTGKISSLQGTMGTRGVPTFNDIYKYIVQETRKGNWDAAQNTERNYWERMTDVERQKLNDYYKTTYGLVSAGAGESALTSQNVAKLPNATQKAKDKEAEGNAEWEQQKQDTKDKMNPLNFVKGLLLPDGKDGKMTLPGVMTTVRLVTNPAVTIGALGFGAASNARKGASELKAMEQAEANADDHSTDYGGQQGYELKQTADKAALDYEDSYQTVQVSAMQLRETEGQLETAKNGYVKAEQVYLNNPTQANYNAYKNALDKYNGLVTAYDTQTAKYNADYADHKTKADAAGVAVTAYNDHITQWEKDLDKSVEEAQKKVDAARADVQAYGQLGYDSSNHSFTYASSEEALEALEVWEKELATLKGWKDTIDAQNTRKEFYALQWESDFEKISAEGEADEGNLINRIALADPESKDGKAFLEFMSTYARYNHLTDTERKIYNYLHAKYGVVRANEAIEFLTEELNRRQGTADAKTDLQKNGVSRFLTATEVAAESGLDRWAQGVKQAFTTDVLPQTATAYEYAARRDAAPNLGRAAMDITSMTTQQIPNMIIAAATAGLGSAAGLSAKAVGYISKGATAANTWISSGGNAYAAARREGKSETEARNYAIMVGGLEATLQYALSGVSKVGGQLSGHAIESLTKNINKVYLQLGARLGLSMLSEGTEEYLQEILEPVVRNIAFGENNEFKLYSNEALYAFALAAVSAGLLEGIDTSGRTIGYARTGKAVNRFSTMKAALVQEALKLSPNTEAYKLAKAISDGKTKATDHNMGELYYEAIRAGVNLDAVYKTVSEEAIKAVTEAQESTVDEANDAKKAASEETTVTEKSKGGETAYVIQKLQENMQGLSGDTPVATISSADLNKIEGRTMAERGKELFERIKGIVTRKGFGDVEINDRSAKDDLSHGIGYAKAAVIPAIPYVIQYGTQIDFQTNWKSRAYDGYIFAAPVVMDGETVYVAAVVKKTSKNRFYLHEVVDSNGNIIKINNGERTNQTSLAAEGDAGAQSPLPNPIISNPAENSNSKNEGMEGVTSSTASDSPSPQGEGVGTQQDTGLRSTLLDGTKYDTREQGKNDPSQSRQSRDSSPQGESQDNPSVGEADSSLYTREPSNREEDEGLGRVEMVYDPELDAEIPTGITDMQEGGQAWYTLSGEDTDPVLQELRQRLLAGEITQEKYDRQVQEREAKLYEAFQKANPALFNRKGATNNGTEGNGVSDGSGQRDDGTGAGEQTGSVDGGTGETAKPRKGTEHSGTKNKWKDIRKNLRGQEVSTKEFGVKIGTETKDLYRIPEEAYTEELRTLSEMIEKKTGKKPIFTLGSLKLQTKKGIKTAKGAILSDGTVIIQADHSKYSATQIAKHELFHHKINLNLLSVPDAIERIQRRFTKEEFEEVYKLYLRAYDGLIDASKEGGLDKLYGEILADAYAGINAFGAETFSDTVNEYMAEQEGKADSTEVEVERETGPPDAMAIDEEFENAIDTWIREKQPSGEQFILGSTGDVLQGLGAIESDIYMLGDKINEILKKHPEISIDEIKKIPYILEDPVLILESMNLRNKNVKNSRLVLFGTYKALNGQPILTVLDLRPVENHLVIDDFQKISSAYTWVNSKISAVDFVRQSKILHADKKRTTSLLKTIGFHWPIALQRSGSVGSISYAGGIVNMHGVDFHSVVTEKHPGEVDGDTFSVDVDEAMEEAVVEDTETAETAPVGEAALERQIERMQDPAYVQQQYAEGGFDAVQRAAAEVKKLQARLDKLNGVQKPKKPKKEVKPVAESKPIIAKKDLKKTVLDMFSVPEGQKKELGKLIDRYAEQLLRDGRLTEEDRKAFFDRLYESGVMAAEADEYLQAGREAVLGSRIYVNDSIKAEFGEDWNSFRQRAFAAGVYLVNDSKHLGVDSAHMELAGILPGLFDANEYDGRTMLERIVEVAEEGKEELVSLDEYVAKLQEQHIITEDEFLDNMERKLDAALKTFAEKAELEVHLRNRTGKVVAENAEKFAERYKKQAERNERHEAESREWFKQKAKKERERYDAKLDEANKENIERLQRQKERFEIHEMRERQLRREMVQQQREAKLLKEEQQRTLKNLQWLKKNWRKVKPEDLEAGKLPPELQKTWEEVLSDIDLYCTALANQTRYSKKYDAAWQEIHDMYETAQETDPNFIPSKDLDRIMDRVKKEKLSELDPETLQNLLNAVLAVRHAYSERNKVLGDMEHELFSETFRDTKSVFGNLKRKTAEKIDKGKNFFAKQLSDENKLLKMCGGDTNSSFWKMTQQLVQGERKVNWYRAEAYGRIQKFMDTHKKWLEGADGQGKNGRWLEVEIPECLSLEVGKLPEFGKTHKIYMTELQRVQLYLESKGEDNLRHMLGGRTFCNRSLYQQGLTKDAWSRDTIYTGGDNSNANRAVTIRLAPETVKAIVKNMTAEEMELAKLLEDYYNSFAKEEINKVSQVLYGFDKAMGRYYAPIRTNTIFTKSEPGVYDETAAGVGHMKERITGSKNPSLNLSALDSFMRHVDDTSRFVGMAIPARNWNTFMNWQTITGGERSSTMGEIEKVWGKEASKQISDLLVELQGGSKERRTGMSGFTDWAYKQHVKAIFAGNIGSVLKQFGSYFMGSGVLDLKTMPKIIAKKFDRALIDRYTHTLKMRETGDYRKEVRTLISADDWTQKNAVTKFIFGGAMTKADTATAGLLWSWAENQVAKDYPKLEKGSKEQIENGESPFYQKVAEVFDEAVELTQSGDTTMRSSELRKSDSAIDRTLTMFKPDAAKGYNLLAKNILIKRHLKESGGSKDEIRAVNAKIGKTVLGMLMNNVWAAAVTLGVSALKGRMRDYEDEEGKVTAKSASMGFLEDIAQGMAGTVAGAEELLEVVGNSITGERWYGIDTPGLSQVEELIEDAGAGLKGITEALLSAGKVAADGGDLGEYWRRHWPNLVGDMTAVGKVAAKYAAGIPVDNVVSYLFRPMKHLLPGITTEMEDWFTQPVKSELEGLKGNALQTRVGNIFDNRAGAGKVDDKVISLVSDLYEQGYAGAVPSETSTSFTIDGEEVKLTEAQRQEMDRLWQKYVPATLNGLMKSKRFGKLPTETQEKVLKKLYSFALELGKEEVVDGFAADNWVQKMKEAKEPAEWLVENAAVGGKYGEFLEAGVQEETAFRAAKAIEGLKPAKGKEDVTELQKCRAAVDATDSYTEQMKLMSVIIHENTYKKLETAQDYYVTPVTYVAVKEQLPKFDADGNGRYKNDEVRMCLNSIPHLSTEARAALWQMLTDSTSEKNNPYSKAVGKKILNAAK